MKRHQASITVRYPAPNWKEEPELMQQTSPEREKRTIIRIHHEGQGSLNETDGKIIVSMRGGGIFSEVSIQKLKLEKQTKKMECRSSSN